jgi:glutathione peroxidase
MQKIILIIMAINIPLLGLLGCSSRTIPSGAKSKTSFHELSTTSLEGKEINFSDFKGKKVLLVNVASKCGFTPQYGELQELYDKYNDQLVIIGFPANNFMKQEPGTNEEIAEFCERNYGVTFLMSEKVSVKGGDMHPVYQWLTNRNQNGWNRKAPSWNFFKYLVDEKGELQAVFSSRTSPLDEKLISKLNPITQ